MLMRKFTLIAIAALISVMAFAQRQARLPQARVFERAVLQVAPVQKTLKTTATRQSRMAKAPEAGTLVELPSGVTPETYYTNGGKFYVGTQSGWSNATKDMSSINVAIDGTDIYIQGLAYYFKEAWIKGTLSGTTATFANGQLVGEDEYGPEYLVGSDDGKTLSEAIVFSFDSSNGVLEATTTYILESESATEVSPYCYWENAVFTKEEPAAPETGTLVELPSGVTPETYYTNGGKFYVGTQSGWSDATKDMSSINVAIDGTDIYIQGLAYWFDEAWVKGTISGTTATFANGQLVGEDEYGPEYLVGSDDGETLSEAIVFSFDSTNGVLEATTTYILESESATEVSPYCYWENAVFTKTAAPSAGYTWKAAEQEYENGEEIASITIGEDITGILDKGDGSLDPKYYNSGTALRMYAGNTLTITAEKPMVKIVFTMTGTAAQMSLEADKGEYSLEGTTGTWTGEADEVVFTVPNVSGNQARIQMIEIFFAGSEGPKLVEVPEDLVVESYFFQGFDTYYEENIESQVEVGFYGENEVYFHNLSGYVDDNWVKGTIEGNVVTIPTTYLGVYQSLFGDMDLSFNGATFIYDAQTGTFTAEEGFTTSADGYDGLFMDEYTNVVLSKIIEKEATPADPEVASFKLYNEPKEGDTELTLATYPSVKFNIPMKDVEGNAMLQEKMSYIIYIVDGEGIQKELTLTTDLYEELTEDLTEIPYTFTDDYDIAPGGSTVYLNQNPEEIATWKKIGVKSIYRGMDIEHSSAIAWYSIEDYIAELNKLITTAITSVNAADKQDARYYDLQGRSVEQGQKGLLIMQYTDGQGNVKTAKVVRK